jgi:16S rRNA U516 pseudouridylate synthase RsuA-like enzyme
MYLTQLLARAGLCSRRKAQTWLDAGTHTHAMLTVLRWRHKQTQANTHNHTHLHIHTRKHVAGWQAGSRSTGK